MVQVENSKISIGLFKQWTQHKIQRSLCEVINIRIRKGKRNSKFRRIIIYPQLKHNERMGTEIRARDYGNV